MTRRNFWFLWLFVTCVLIGFNIANGQPWEG
jgi:hypothetical protein